MNVVLYKIDRVIIAQYVFILGSTILFKFKTNNDLDTYDHHAILFLYYIGLLVYNLNIPKQSLHYLGQI